MKTFNTTVSCVPNKHYMVDMSSRIHTIISSYIDQGKYFVINRARQYGKTTTLQALKRALKSNYHVLSISFAGRPSMFKSEQSFVNGFVRKLHTAMEQVGMDKELFSVMTDSENPFEDLGEAITELCDASDKEIVLMIDEVDEATNNEIMIHFLATLRDKYIFREDGVDNTFKSVILAGVYDIKNLKLKIRPDADHRYNSPWNVAADFYLDMSLEAQGIAGMLREYRADYQLGFDAEWFGQQIYDYTSGYPYLVSKLCWLLDNKVWQETEFKTREAAWTERGLQRALKLLVTESNTLYDDLNKKLAENAALKELIYNIVVCRKERAFNLNDELISLGYMFGWLKEADGIAVISNRIFETVICDKLIQEKSNEEWFRTSYEGIYLFKTDNALDMNKIMERFAAHYKELYSSFTKAFLEREARMLFLCFLKPIINGTGNYYIEPESFDKTRTDIVVDYHGKRYIIELKLWHGESYEQAGKEQLVGYLNRYDLSEGWLLSFCFNKNKEMLVGLQTTKLDDKVIFETIV